MKQVEYTPRGLRLVLGILEELRQGKTVIYRPVAQCRHLDALTGKTPEQLRSWDLIRPEFKRAYPLEKHALEIGLQKIKQRLKSGDLKWNKKG